MDLKAHSCQSQSTDSGAAGESLGRALLEAFGDAPLRAVIVYATVNHDQKELLDGLRAVVGSEPAVVGCSSQGIMTRGAVHEGGYVAAAMGLGGSGLEIACASQRDLASDTRQKGLQLAEQLCAALGREPRLMVLLYDPLCGADTHQLLDGIRERTTAPVVGGGASQPWGPMVRTYQYSGGEVFSNGAVALGLAGSFSVEIGVCHGTSPTGLVMTLTRAENNRLIEIDGRPALDIWRETTGCGEGDTIDQDHVAAWAIGVQEEVVDRDGSTRALYLIRAAFGFDEANKAVTVQAAIPEGTKIMFHHRTTSAVMQGTAKMAEDLAQRLNGRRTWAVLGFECGARTSPFLGISATVEENTALQQIVAPEAPWLGLLAWGEIAPAGKRPEFHNYTYPLVVLTEAVS